MTEAIASLIEKLEGAEVGARKLDLDITQALSMKLWGRRHPHNNSHQWMTEIGGRSVPVPRFTTSLDAALALAARVIDERGPISINICLAGSAQVVIDSLGPCDPVMAQVVARDPALALTIAILRVKKDRGL